MRDVLAHTRCYFNTERVIAGPDKFYAMSRRNLAIGRMRDNLADAEADADTMHNECERVNDHMIGWGAIT